MKLLLLGDEASPSAIRMELTSENDLFFNYTHTLEPDGFRTVQEAQKLMVEFGEYPSVLTRMLDTCIREPHSHLAVFVMQRGGRAHLDFIQVLGVVVGVGVGVGIRVRVRVRFRV